MSIEKGQAMPDGAFGMMTDGRPGRITTDELFKGRKVVLFSIPGAFTPTCSKEHLPGYVNNAGALRAKGVDRVACMAVNDVFVMDAWGRSAGVGDSVLMLADGNGDYARALGLERDFSGFGMGMRGQRFSIVADDGIVTELNVEEGGGLSCSSAEAALEQL
ncbi:MAG: peroxiredoxin [Gammaproteobacteria bacterium]|nr:peroxiredoxin [Gammaproteobacteria bacterium]MCY4254930.1 peroxiredoxin [Gammaproteobacteria bacterium]